VNCAELRRTGPADSLTAPYAHASFGPGDALNNPLQEEMA
jgi:hypothetical protein